MTPIPVGPSAGAADPVPDGRRQESRRRTGLYVAAAAVAGIDLGAKAWAQQALPAGGIDAGPVDLRLAYNPGVAFSLAAEAPSAAVLVVTGLITAVIAVLAWRTAATGSRWRATALAAILGGAVANVADRAADGVVTDYLHTGWWPTFNLADTAIVTGAALLLLAGLRAADDPGGAAPGDGMRQEGQRTGHE